MNPQQPVPQTGTLPIKLYPPGVYQGGGELNPYDLFWRQALYLVKLLPFLLERIGFEPMTELTNKFTVCRFGPLSHLSKILGPVGFEPTTCPL